MAHEIMLHWGKEWTNWIEWIFMQAHARHAIATINLVLKTGESRSKKISWGTIEMLIIIQTDRD